MKYFMAAFMFVLTLGLTFETIASEPVAACTEQSTEKCTSAPAPHKTNSTHQNLSDKMNALFPEKQKDAQLSATPAVVEITTPKFLSKISGEAKLEWKAARGANTYHVQVATDPNFKWLVAEDHFVKTTSFAFTKAESGKKYFWRVAAYNTVNDAMFAKSNFSSSVFVAK